MSVVVPICVKKKHYDTKSEAYQATKHRPGAMVLMCGYCYVEADHSYRFVVSK